jgi:hypothetical protein
MRDMFKPYILAIFYRIPFHDRYFYFFFNLLKWVKLKKNKNILAANNWFNLKNDHVLIIFKLKRPNHCASCEVRMDPSR